MSLSRLRFARTTIVALAAAALSGCVSVYVDPALPRVGKPDMPAVASPRPVQLLYEFQTRGSVNARATENTRKYVEDVVAASGLFSSVTATPAGNRRLLVTINNVPVTSEADARNKGFVTGLTFGLVGSNVTDGYLCTATLEDAGVVRAATSAEHALHGTIGAAQAPKGLSAVPMAEASRTIVEQLTWNVLKKLGGAVQ